MTRKEHDHHRHPAHAAAIGHAPARRRVVPVVGRKRWSQWRRGLVRFLRRPLMRKLYWSSAIVVAAITVGLLALWWRLSSGPIELELATPWLKAAIEENFGGAHSVVVGGTQIERDEKGRTSLRLRDIVVSDADGTVVARAPKAEVGLSGMSLFSGHMRAQSLNLVGAEMAVRIETDGRVTVFAGADKRPIATAAPKPPLPPPPVPQAGSQAGAQAVPPSEALRSDFQSFAGILSWLDGVGASGLDGHDLHELGLKGGNLTVDDRRSGKRWTFDQINASLTRPAQGGIIFRLESDNRERPWQISAAMRPLTDGVRAVGIEARKVQTHDIILAMRLNEGAIDVDLPLSASLRADVLPDGTPQVIQGEVVVDAGSIIDRSEPRATIPIDQALFRIDWDARRGNMIVPFQVHSGGNQLTMQAMVAAPREQNGPWQLAIARSDAVIDPVILGAGSDKEGFALNRLAVRARIDPGRKRIDLDQGDFGRIDTRATHNVGVAVSGSLDWSTPEPHLAFGVAGTRMSMAVMKRLWPVFVATDVRSWVVDHMSGGMIERVVVAGNAQAAAFKLGGPPTPEDGLSIDIETSGTTVKPIDKLPAIRDADLTVRITGKTVRIDLGRGTVEAAGGRKLSIAGGVFEIPDTHLKPAPSRTSFRVDGGVPAAAALLSGEGLRDNFSIPLDPNTSRGTVTAQVTVSGPIGKNVPEGSSNYTIGADLLNFSADKLLLGQKLEANTLRVAAAGDGYQIKGEVRVNGTPASIELRQQKGEPDADLKLTATLDEAARHRFSMDLGSNITGSIPIKVNGRFGDASKEDRLNVEADLTQAKIDNLLPGWVKPAGKPARATYTLQKTDKSTRLDNLSIDAGSTVVRGSIEIDNNGDILAANFPTFSVSDGDKVTLKADRGPDNALRVAMRGDVYDGRNFVKASMAGDAADKKQKQTDVDLDIKIGAVAGHNGEVLRGLDLRLTRRGGHIRSFSMTSKIGRDTALNGDLRLRARDNHQVIFFETEDAGSLFRFTDTYPRMYGGSMWVAMDPPTQDQTPQVGYLYISNFVVRGEPALDRVLSGAPNGATPQKGSVEFSELHTDFTRFTGRMAIRDGVVRGPLVGATIEGQLDYLKDDVHLRGTFVPFYGLNNMFGKIPIVGFFLGGGSNEGLLGITYEAVGPPSAPRISVNPVSAIAPGLLRKFIPSPGTFDRNFVPPQQ